MAAPFLARPDMMYKDSYIAGTREFEAEKRPFRWKIEMLDEHFDEYLQVLHDKEFDPDPGSVPQSEYWLIADGAYVGNLRLRHALNESLMQWGGNIGYEIRASQRGRGYGLLQCQLGLEKAREIGLERVLITCDDSNIASAKIIEACGGGLENTIVLPDSPIPKRRYWITL